MRRHPEAILCVLLALALVMFPRCSEAAEPVARDKAAHFIVGLGVSAIGVAASGMWLPADAPAWAPAAVGLAGSMVAGAVKEVADGFGLGTLELDDWIATVAGGVAGIVVSGLANWLMTGRPW